MPCAQPVSMAAAAVTSNLRRVSRMEKSVAWELCFVPWSDSLRISHLLAYTTIGDEGKNNHRRHLPLLFSTSSPRSRDNLFDYSGFGIGIVLRVLPVLSFLLRSLHLPFFRAYTIIHLFHHANELCIIVP